QTPESSSFKVLVDETNSNGPAGILEDGDWIYYMGDEVYKVSKNGGALVKKTNGLGELGSLPSGNSTFIQDDAYIYLYLSATENEKQYAKIFSVAK
ncbi:MAG: hypothetical protein GY754_14190, partial [bacterium]|nr:hypothetical protein [bacterium]